MEAYLQHKGGENGPFSTESVQIRETKTPKSGQTASGYGRNLPTPYEVFWRNRWRRVRGICFSNYGTLYIKNPDEKGKIILVEIYR